MIFAARSSSEKVSIPQAISGNEYGCGASYEDERLRESLTEITRYRFIGDDNVYKITIPDLASWKASASSISSLWPRVAEARRSGTCCIWEAYERMKAPTV